MKGTKNTSEGARTQKKKKEFDAAEAELELQLGSLFHYMHMK